MVKTRSSTRASNLARPPPQSAVTGPAKQRRGRRKRSSTSAKAKRHPVKLSKPSKPVQSSQPSDPAEPSTQPQLQRVAFELPPEVAATDLPSPPLCPKSDKCRSHVSRTLTTRKQVSRWSWFAMNDAISWFDHITAYCRFCKVEVSLSPRSDYDKRHWRDHWARYHKPSRQKGKQPGCAKSPPKKRGKQHASRARRSSKLKKTNSPPTPHLSSDDSEDMVVDSDVTPLPETPQSPPTIQLTEAQPDTKRSHGDVNLAGTPAPHLHTPSPDPSVPPEIHVLHPTPPRELGGSHEDRQDDMRQGARSGSPKSQPGQGTERELSPIMQQDALTSPGTLLDLDAMQDTPYARRRSLSPVLLYGSPDSPGLNELADFAENSPRVWNMSPDMAQGLTEVDFKAARMLVELRQDTSGLGLHLGTSPSAPFTHAGTGSCRV